MSIENISQELSKLKVNMKGLKQRKNNPRRGNIEAIKESLQVNGQYRPIIINKKTNEILAGNHTYKAAKELGWEEIAATYVNVNNKQADKIVLVDNKTSDLAEYNLDELLKSVENLEGDFEGTGFNEDYFSKIFDVKDLSNNGESFTNELSEEIIFSVVVDVNSEIEQVKVLELLDSHNYNARAMSF